MTCEFDAKAAFTESKRKNTLAWRRIGEAMTKKARIQQARLDAMELEFARLLPERLAECAGGRWGLFGQNAIADPEDQYWTWPAIAARENVR